MGVPRENRSMGNYSSEQGADYGEDNRPLSADLKPWLRDEWGLDVFITEFPYFQYVPGDLPVDHDEKTRYYAEEYGDHDRWSDPENWPQSVRQFGPYRTDVVGVNVDRRALRTRFQRVGRTTSLNGSGQTKRRRRRTYLTFRGDGPMTRDYWETGDRPQDSLPGYGEDSARRAFGWLKKRGFLIQLGASPQYDAVDIPLHVHARTHAFELKLSRGEWDTALEQAARADVFADYRWVVYDHATATDALANTDRFKSEGVGLITVTPEDGPTVHVWAEQCTRDVDRSLLDRYNVERWDLNERVLSALNTRREHHQDPDSDPDRYAPGVPDILGDIGAGELETDSDPPTVNAERRERPTAENREADSGDQHALTEFGGDGGE